MSQNVTKCHKMSHAFKFLVQNYAYLVRLDFARNASYVTKLSLSLWLPWDYLSSTIYVQSGRPRQDKCAQMSKRWPLYFGAKTLGRAKIWKSHFAGFRLSRLDSAISMQPSVHFTTTLVTFRQGERESEGVNESESAKKSDRQRERARKSEKDREREKEREREREKGRQRER